MRILGPQPRKLQVITAALLPILLSTGLACFYAVSRRHPVVQREEEVVDRSSEKPLFTFVPNATANVPARPVYPYSVIPGGIASGKELAMRMAEDPVVAKHYSSFNVSRARVVRASRGKLVFVAYRVRDKVFFTRKRLLIRKGEELITDGTLYARVRCGNRITDSPVPPTSTLEPSTKELDPPLPPSSPPVLFPSLTVKTEQPPLPEVAPPSIGGPYSPPASPTPNLLPPFSVFPNSGPRPPGSKLPPAPESPYWPADPTPSPSSNVQPVPEPKTIWLASIGAALVLVRLWRNRRKT